MYMAYSRDIISEEQIRDAIAHTQSMIAAARYLGVSRDRFNRYAKKYGLFKPNQAGKGTIKLSERRYDNDEIFCKVSEKIPPSVLGRRIREVKEWKCECCGISEWMGKDISLEIHHIDGDRLNNDLSNLQLLCPNCHSQTDNWRSRNQRGYNKTNPKVSDEQLLEALKKYHTIQEALMSLGLAGGANYNRVYKLLKKNQDIYKEFLVS
jgi:Zn-dependent peptidase ImmA (M78 family)